MTVVTAISESQPVDAYSTPAAERSAPHLSMLPRWRGGRLRR